jgi:tight adherence protein B
MSHDVAVALLGWLAGLATLLLWLGVGARRWSSSAPSAPLVAPGVEEADVAASPDASARGAGSRPGWSGVEDLQASWRGMRRRAPRNGRWLARQLYRAGLPLTSRELALASGVGTALAFLLGWTLGRDARWGVLSVLILLCGAVVTVRRQQNKRALLFSEQMLDVLELLLTSRRAGFSLAQSVMMVAEHVKPPAGTEFDIVRREIRFGRDTTQALRHLNERVRNEDLRLLIDALILQNATGGDLIPVLEMLVATVRQRMQLRREVRALTAQGRVSSYVLALLPVFVGGTLVMLDPIDMSFFWTSLLGGGLLTVALIGVAVGFMLIQRIVAVQF